MRPLDNLLHKRALLEQLAEECSELSHAALKTIRAEGWSQNPTPVKPEEAWANLVEEFNDVVNAAYVLGLCEKPGSMLKVLRWVERIEEARNVHAKPEF